jgi:hypothetical protein
MRICHNGYKESKTAHLEMLVEKEALNSADVMSE